MISRPVSASLLHARRSRYDLVLIGAGIRAIPANFAPLERLISVVHEGAPQAKICFNTRPDDTEQAVRRWIAPPDRA